MMELKGEVGKYKIIKKIGSGGFGSVYLAEDKFLKSLRALKIPHRSNVQIEKLLNESVLQCRLLDHPNIVKLLTVDIIDRIIIMVMEYVDGEDLEHLIDKNDKLPVPEAVDYFRQILSALEFAHKQKVIHRDIRPSNIMIDKNGTVKITDFGTSTSVEEKQYATTKIGSPPYMAPEQFEGRAVLASDIYSAGCLFYEMVTGFPPIIMSNPLEIYKKAKAGNIEPLHKKYPDVKPELSRIISKTLESTIQNRYKNVTEVLNDLKQMNSENGNNENELESIKLRLNARSERKDYTCWYCKKISPQKMARCPYCGEEQ